MNNLSSFYHGMIFSLLNKDNLDSREAEEQHFKGDDVTHNKKEHRNPEKHNR